MTRRSRPRSPVPTRRFATLLESRPGIPRPIDDDANNDASIDVDDLPGRRTSPVPQSAVLASVDARAPRLGDPESRPARQALRQRLMEAVALLESRTDHARPPSRDSALDPRRAAQRAKLERAAREMGERIKKRARRR